MDHPAGSQATSQPAAPESTSSPLLALPLELRRQIYTHAFSLSPRPEPSSATGLTKHPSLLTDHIDTSLLLVCRQMYHEARLLPFQRNNFSFSTTGGGSVTSAVRFLQRLADWQREALRSVEIAVVGREVVEGWRREAGWEVAVHLLSSSKVQVRVWIQEGDVWIGDRVEGAAGWLPHGGNVGPVAGVGWVALAGTVVRMSPKWGDVTPVVGTGRGGWVHKLLLAGVPENVRLECCWS